VNIQEFNKLAQELINNNFKTKNEFYFSQLYKLLINKNEIIIPFHVKNTIHLGTYNEILQYQTQTQLQNKKLRICFDLDNTLVSSPRINGDYSTVEPIEKNIKFLRYLKNFDHTIIIYTARRMKTHNGNVGKCLCDIGQITFDTLKKFNIPFDEIYFGKPYADVYIDDLALNCYDNLEKELGYYMDKIDPRSFNTLELNTLQTYKKISKDLSGEIYYYKNIPNSIKDLFPIFIDYDINNKW